MLMFIPSIHLVLEQFSLANTYRLLRFALLLFLVLYFLVICFFFSVLMLFKTMKIQAYFFRVQSHISNDRHKSPFHFFWFFNHTSLVFSISLSGYSISSMKIWKTSLLNDSVCLSAYYHHVIPIYGYINERMLSSPPLLFSMLSNAKLILLFLTYLKRNFCLLSEMINDPLLSNKIVVAFLLIFIFYIYNKVVYKIVGSKINISIRMTLYQQYLRSILYLSNYS